MQSLCWHCWLQTLIQVGRRPGRFPQLPLLQPLASCTKSRLAERDTKLVTRVSTEQTLRTQNAETGGKKVKVRAQRGQSQGPRYLEVAAFESTPDENAASFKCSIATLQAQDPSIAGGASWQGTVLGSPVLQVFGLAAQAPWHAAKAAGAATLPALMCSRRRTGFSRGRGEDPATQGDLAGLERGAQAQGIKGQKCLHSRVEQLCCGQRQQWARVAQLWLELSASSAASHIRACKILFCTPEPLWNPSRKFQQAKT